MNVTESYKGNEASSINFWYVGKISKRHNKTARLFTKELNKTYERNVICTNMCRYYILCRQYLCMRVIQGQHLGHTADDYLQGRVSDGRPSETHEDIVALNPRHANPNHPNHPTPPHPPTPLWPDVTTLYVAESNKSDQRANQPLILFHN